MPTKISPPAFRIALGGESGKGLGIEFRKSFNEADEFGAEVADVITTESWIGNLVTIIDEISWSRLIAVTLDNGIGLIGVFHQNAVCFDIAFKVVADAMKIVLAEFKDKFDFLIDSLELLGGVELHFAVLELVIKVLGTSVISVAVGAIARSLVI